MIEWWTCPDCRDLLGYKDEPHGEGPWTCPKCGEVWK